MVENARAPVQKPSTNRDFDFFYDGLNRGEFLVQKCDACGIRRHPASPMCPACRSLAFRTEDIGTAGTVYSYIVHHQPAYPDYPSPHVIALVEMAPDIRVLGAMVGCAPGEVAIGMNVSMEFVEHEDGFSLHRFRSVDVK